MKSLSDTAEFPVRSSRMRNSWRPSCLRLRADICMLEAYDRTVPQPLSCPITAFGGKLDRTVPLAHIGGWRDQTTSSFTQILIDEDHLYLQSAREHLTGYIRETLQASACQR